MENKLITNYFIQIVKQTIKLPNYKSTLSHVAGQIKYISNCTALHFLEISRQNACNIPYILTLVTHRSMRLYFVIATLQWLQSTLVARINVQSMHADTALQSGRTIVEPCSRS